MVSNVGIDLHQCDTVHPTGRHLNPIAENGEHPFCVPPGRSQIEVGWNVSGRFEGWLVDLDGGQSYVLRGHWRYASLQIWIEDEATGKRVTPVVSLLTKDD